jgi:hypothetical protein
MLGMAVELQEPAEAIASKPSAFLALLMFVLRNKHAKGVPYARAVVANIKCSMIAAIKC